MVGQSQERRNPPAGTGRSKKQKVRRVTRQGIPGAAGMDSEGGPWVNGLPDVETREGLEHAVKAALARRRVG